MFSRFLAITIGLLMHFSLCTGGAFAVLSAGMQAYVTQSAKPSYSSTRMSYGGVGYLSCVTSKKVGSDISANERHGCTDASECLTREFARKRDLFFASLAPVVISSALPRGFAVSYPVTDTVTGHPKNNLLVASVHPGLSSTVKIE